MDRYPEGASSNPARVNVFQLTSAVLDYHEKCLFSGKTQRFHANLVSLLREFILCSVCVSSLRQVKPKTHGDIFLGYETFSGDNTI